MVEIFKKGDVVKVDHKGVRGIVKANLDGGFIDIMCEDEYGDYRARQEDCQIHLYHINIFDLLEKQLSGRL